MIEYTPHNWVVLKISNEGKEYYKVLAGWDSSFDMSWRMNSGITRVEKDEDYLLFHGFSGSVYRCHERDCNLSNITLDIYEQLVERFGEAVKLMSEDTNWLNIDYTS